MGQNALPGRVGIYCRLSYAPDGSLEKVERQEADCRELAVRLRWPVSEAHIFPDNSRSAWQRNRKRPQWDRMLAAIEAGEIDAIIVYHGDRLIRQPYDLEKLISIADSKGIRVASPSGTRDLDNSDDRFILRIEAAQACRESDNISRRVRRSVEARVERGLTQSGGRRPCGYGLQVGTRRKVDRRTGEELEVPVYDTNQQVPEEAEFLVDAAERLLAGMPKAAVVRRLNASGHRTTVGNPWTEKALKNLLLSPRIAGLIDHGGQLYEAAWDGILELEMWEDIRALYEKSAKENPYMGRERKYLLSGVAECFRCHKPGAKKGQAHGAAAICKSTPAKCKTPHVTMRTKPTGGRNRKDSRIYYCPACKGVGRNLELLDAYVEGRVLWLLNDPDLVDEIRALAQDGKPGIGAEIDALERRQREQKKKLDNLADHPDVDADVAVLALASFDRKIRSLRAQLAQSSNVRLITRMLGIAPDGWKRESVDVRAAVVQNLYRVIVLPTTLRGPGFDPASVALERRPLTAAAHADTGLE